MSRFRDGLIVVTAVPSLAACRRRSGRRDALTGGAAGRSVAPGSGARGARAPTPPAGGGNSEACAQAAAALKKHADLQATMPHPATRKQALDNFIIELKAMQIGA